MRRSLQSVQFGKVIDMNHTCIEGGRLYSGPVDPEASLRIVESIIKQNEMILRMVLTVLPPADASQMAPIRCTPHTPTASARSRA